MPRGAFSKIRSIQFRIRISRYWTQRVQPDSKITRAVRAFLREKHGSDELAFDCFAFACAVAGIELHSSRYLHGFWDLHDLPEKMHSGDVVFFLDRQRRHFKHAAVYFGGGLCISVYGGGGDLEFSRIKDMQREWDAPDVLLAVPRPQAAT